MFYFKRCPDESLLEAYYYYRRTPKLKSELIATIQKVGPTYKVAAPEKEDISEMSFSQYEEAIRVFLDMVSMIDRVHMTKDIAAVRRRLKKGRRKEVF